MRTMFLSSWFFLFVLFSVAHLQHSSIRAPSPGYMLGISLRNIPSVSVFLALGVLNSLQRYKCPHIFLLNEINGDRNTRARTVASLSSLLLVLVKPPSSLKESSEQWIKVRWGCLHKGCVFWAFLVYPRRVSVELETNKHTCSHFLHSRHSKKHKKGKKLQHVFNVN